MSSTTDVFNTNTTVAGSYIANKAVLQLSSDSKLNGMLITDMGVQYQRPMQRITALNSSGSGVEIYNVYGIPQGSATIGSLIGPKASAQATLSTLGSPCTTDNNVNIKFNGTVCSSGSAEGEGGKANRTLYGVSLGGTSFNINSNDMMCRDNLSLTFNTMSDSVSSSSSSSSTTA